MKKIHIIYLIRSIIKSALRGNIDDKISAMEMIDFTTMKDFPGKKESIIDIYKIIAFQYGQLFSLIDGYESDSYTKNGIIKNYPDLEPMLNRKELSECDYETLNKYRDRLLSISK